MKLATRIGLLLQLLLMVFVLGISAFFYLSYDRHLPKDFAERYNVLALDTGITFAEFEKVADREGKSAARAFYEIDKQRGPVSPEEMSKIARDLNVDALYTYDIDGFTQSWSKRTS